ncbi:MAG: hypothetical protein HY744_18620 [Deltaproteobacteria bacterium]|nr:hypothetical protein [Deltaproteobacteria bacterium]
MNRDFVDLLCAFNDHEVDYLVVGAHALAAHGCVRATKDLDVWIRPTPENADRAYRALAFFGAPLSDLGPADLCTPGTVFQIGVAPLRIDVLTRIDGIEFGEAWAGKVAASFGDTPTFVLSREHLIRNKRAAGRLQDLADVERLERGGDD